MKANFMNWMSLIEVTVDAMSMSIRRKASDVNHPGKAKDRQKTSRDNESGIRQRSRQTS